MIELGLSSRLVGFELGLGSVLGLGLGLLVGVGLRLGLGLGLLVDVGLRIGLRLELGGYRLGLGG